MVGVDEVGRGAWAGPLLVVAARSKKNTTLPSGLTDSKLLSSVQKQQLYEQLQYVCDFGEGWVDVDEIDEFGLGSALKIAAKRAIADLSVNETEEIIIDGKVDLLDGSFSNKSLIIGADLTVPIVSAASVFAKVTRDNKMQKLHYVLPEYGCKCHNNRGTPEHIKVLKNQGVSAQHRKSFKPIMELL